LIRYWRLLAELAVRLHPVSAAAVPTTPSSASGALPANSPKTIRRLRTMGSLRDPRVTPSARSALGIERAIPRSGW
jgi:hypothetical protein